MSYRGGGGGRGTNNFRGRGRGRGGGSPTKAPPAFTVRADAPPIAVAVSLIGTFGWKETADPPASSTAADLSAHFRKRLQTPGVPPYLVSPLPRQIAITPFDAPQPCPKYDRPPNEALLCVAEHYGFDWRAKAKAADSTNGAYFITPRRNLLAFLDADTPDKAWIDAQRITFTDTGRSVVLLRRVIGYDSINRGDTGYQLESKITVRTADTSDQFRSLLDLTIGRHSILLSGEIDSVVPASSDSKSTAPAAAAAAGSVDNSFTLKRVRELKSIWAGNEHLWSLRAPTMYLQSAVAGTPAIIVGLKERGNGTATVSLDLKEISVESGFVNTNIAHSLFGQLNAFLDWINATLPPPPDTPINGGDAKSAPIPSASNVRVGSVFRLNPINKSIAPATGSAAENIVSVEALSSFAASAKPVSAVAATAAASVAKPDAKSAVPVVAADSAASTTAATAATAATATTATTSVNELSESMSRLRVANAAPAATPGAAGRAGPVPCRFFAQNKCVKGDACTFSHVRDAGTGAAGRGRGRDSGSGRGRGRGSADRARGTRG